MFFRRKKQPLSPIEERYLAEHARELARLKEAELESELRAERMLKFQADFNSQEKAILKADLEANRDSILAELRRISEATR